MPSIRTLTPAELRLHRQLAHQDSLALLEALGQEPGGQTRSFPLLETINPPLWEFGHIAWFNEFWTVRNPHRRLGMSAPGGDRPPSQLGLDDSTFDSAVLAHSLRWDLPQWSLGAIERALREGHAQGMQSLEEDIQGGYPLYFQVLSLAHELMHAEAFQMTGVTLGLALPGPGLDQLLPEPQRLAPIPLMARAWWSRPTAHEFWFDNEGAEGRMQVEHCEIDAAPVSHGQYWEFVEAGGYAREELWTPEGWRWRGQSGLQRPIHLESQNGQLLRAWQGDWRPIHPDCPMLQVSAHEAEAWCSWAGHRLPTEAEWLAGADAGMRWGQVWEWTSQAFAPFRGFAPHPYREYSQPWFGSHRLLKGASWMTHALLVDPRYRNFFCAQRTDVFSGFRSVRARKSA